MPRFTRASFAFLRDLSANNDKAWMDAHRDDFRRLVAAPATDIARAWADIMRPHGYAPSGRGVSPMHYDRRFTRGDPYRPYVAIRLRHRNALPGAPGPTLVLWVQPRASFLAAGVHQHNGESLARIRNAIQADPDGWAQVRTLGALDDTDLAVRAPEAPFQDDLRRRHYTVTRHLTHQEITASDFVERLGRQTIEMLPFAEFTARALYGGPVR